MLMVVRYILRLLPGTLGTRLVIHLSGMRITYRLKEEEKKWLNRVERFSYGNGKVAWSAGEGPLVVLVHGYAGCAAQLYKIADALVASGYRVVAPDITSHGQSEGRKIMFRDFIDDVAELETFLKMDVYAYIGHSAGAMCMMAGRRIHGLKAKKYVCIAAPSYPYPPVRAVKRRLNPPGRILCRYQGFLAAQFEGSWDTLTGQIYEYKEESQLLLINDRNDRFLLPGDLDAIRSQWPVAETLLTHDAGHEEILRSETCIERICTFLR